MKDEELQRQYDEDCKNHGRPWELWEFDTGDNEGFQDCIDPPAWFDDYKYRRKEPPFQPESFSGLNREDARKLIDKDIEYSLHGQLWFRGGLYMIDPDGTPFSVSDQDGQRWVEYIRTCPETHTHPTITIGGVKLPRPEYIEPFAGTHYFSVDNGNVIKRVWSACPHDMDRVRAGNVHHTEDRAQAWADWWENTVMAAVRG